MNQKVPHPKHLEIIVDYLGYVPNITSSFEKLGTRTKLYRIKNKLSLETFLKKTNIDSNIIKKLEHSRYCKIPKTLNEMIIEKLKQEPLNLSKILV